VRNETKRNRTKRNEIKRNEPERNETKPIETKRNVTSFRLISFRFVSIGFVSFRLISFRSISFRFYFVSHFTGTRTTGRSEGKNLSNIRLEIKYIILGVDHLPPPHPPVYLIYLKTNCIQKKYYNKTNYFRCWSVLTPYDPFYLGNIFLDGD
jgi:hypothetical protein